MQGVKTLCSATKDDLKTEAINEGLSNLAGIDIMPTVTISLVICILSLIANVFFVPNIKSGVIIVPNMKC